jgi:hypothetical protein
MWFRLSHLQVNEELNLFNKTIVQTTLYCYTHQGVENQNISLIPNNIKRIVSSEAKKYFNTIINIHLEYSPLYIQKLHKETV